MLLQIVGVRGIVSVRDATLALKNGVLNGNDRLSLSHATSIFNIIKDGRTVYLNVPHPQLVLQHFVVDKDSMRRFLMTRR